MTTLQPRLKAVGRASKHGLATTSRTSKAFSPTSSKKDRRVVEENRFFDAVLGILEGLDCAESLAIAIMVKSSDIRQAVLHSDIDPLQYNSPASFKAAYQARKLLSKLDYEIGVDREAVAVEAFWESEVDCLATNEKFRKYWQGDTSVFTLETDDILSKARFIIARILGPLPSPDDLHPRFGPGTTYSCRGSSSTLIDKISESAPSMTDGMEVLLKHLPPLLIEAYTSHSLAGDDLEYVSFETTIVEGSRFMTVPKNAKTFRGICSEPSLNMIWQLAYGSFMKDRLRRAGLNLSRQAEYNGHYAQIGSRDGYYATIDLKGASDSIAHNLVLDLLPVDWAAALHQCRSPKTLIGGKWHELQKWSSMGNGYTFELETMIFYAICLAVSNDSRVFGDDIIVPSDCSSTVITALGEIGFKTNASKTFVSGPFRESCGQDFFHGVSVRPLFIKEIPYGITERIFGLANLVREIANRASDSLVCSSRFRRPWVHIIQWLPYHHRLYGPKWLGDIVLHSDDDLWHRATRYRYGLSYLKAWVPRVQTKGISRYSSFAQMAYALYGGASTGSEIRGKASYRIKTLNVVLTNDEGARWG